MVVAIVGTGMALSGVGHAAAQPTTSTLQRERVAEAGSPLHPPPVGSLRMVSFRSTGKPASLLNTAEDLTHDGRYLAFVSNDDAMVPGANHESQLYVRDLAGGAIRLVTRGVDGQPGNDYTAQASMSADGRRIVFESTAGNLVPGSSGTQVYLYDAATASLSLVSRAPSGAPGNGDSRDPQISADGAQVVFQSRATDLDPGAPVAPGLRQVYIAEVGGGAVRLATPGADGVPADGDSFEPSISGDGRLISFRSEATNLASGEGDSDDDVFLLDTVEQSLTQVSRSPTDRTGVSLEAELSDDGGHLVFVSTLSGLTGDPMRRDEFHVYVRDLASGEVERVTRAADGGLLDADERAQHPTISSDGSMITYESDATNLMDDQNDDNGYVDTFAYDNALDTTTTLVSRKRTGDTANASSGAAVLSGDGAYVAFVSGATDLSTRDRNRAYDIFVKRLS